jgi:hypothetical protein
MKVSGVIERAGKVFKVVAGLRMCLACERVFTPREAAEHALMPCYPPTK